MENDRPPALYAMFQDREIVLKEHLTAKEQKFRAIAEVFLLEDGFYYIETFNNRALYPHNLRRLADIVDELNKPWEEQLNAYFKKQSESDEINAGFIREPIWGEVF